MMENPSATSWVQEAGMSNLMLVARFASIKTECLD
jgi:hypothetical protein